MEGERKGGGGIGRKREGHREKEGKEERDREWKGVQRLKGGRGPGKEGV